MKKVLSLDISSSTIGWCLFEMEKGKINLLEYGHIKPPSKAKANKQGFDFSFRLASIYDSMVELLLDKKPDEVVVEEYAKKFSPGRSSANTIIVLAAVNEVVSLVCFQILQKEVFRIPVTKIRSEIRKEYNHNIKCKESVLKLSQELFPSFKTVLNKNGNIKKECYDESDALVVGLAHKILNY